MAEDQRASAGSERGMRGKFSPLQISHGLYGDSANWLALLEQAKTILSACEQTHGSRREPGPWS